LPTGPTTSPTTGLTTGVRPLGRGVDRAGHADPADLPRPVDPAGRLALELPAPFVATLGPEQVSAELGPLLAKAAIVALGMCETVVRRAIDRAAEALQDLLGRLEGIRAWAEAG